MALEFRNQIAPRSGYSILMSILNREWTQITATRRMLGQREKRGAFWCIAYDELTKQDLEALMMEGIHLKTKAAIPLGLIEATSIHIGGNFDAIPRNYYELTVGGVWRDRCNDPDTLIFVDVTVLQSRRGILGGQLLNEAIRRVASAKEQFEYVLTYSPNDERLLAWHQAHGAIKTGYVIANARAGYKIPDVQLMDYSSLVRSMRVK